jgi:Epoxide hydrolase N terminus
VAHRSGSRRHSRTDPRDSLRRQRAHRQVGTPAWRHRPASVPADPRAGRPLSTVGVPMSINVQPFRVHVPESDLVELRTRLMRTRWPEAAPLPGWSQGVPLGVVQDLCRYWAEDYQWRAAEARLNAVGQAGSTTWWTPSPPAVPVASPTVSAAVDVGSRRPGSPRSLLWWTSGLDDALGWSDRSGAGQAERLLSEPRRRDNGGVRAPS